VNTYVIKLYLVMGLLLSFPFLSACEKELEITGKIDSMPTPEILEGHCRDMVGAPRVERISEHVWAAMGYDLANTVLIRTPAGYIVIDPGMSPKRARAVKQALESEVPGGPVAAVVYTHSHIDHVGGASVWAKAGVPIWSTEALPEHLFKQYQVFLPAESARGRRQFGQHVPLSALPCSALGKRPDFKAVLNNGTLLPTHTFSGKKTLDFSGFKVELIEAHGETHDHLVVWVPSDKTLVAGDNFYWSFPNLYTIRGTSPRPVDAWIESLDTMRRLIPEHMIPGHTRAVHGRKEINRILTDYRDIIQWVRDAVVRGANKGLDLDTLAETIKLPPHLAEKHYGKELYGQVDWSVRALYTNNLGWFDGRADRLYPMRASEAAAREIALMGGKEKVLALAKEAQTQGKARWSVHLLAKIRTSGLSGNDVDLDNVLAGAYEALAQEVYNTNGRGYLLERAYELRNGSSEMSQPTLQPSLVAGIPLDHIFRIMAGKLKVDKAESVHETLVFRFPDENRRFNLTVRRGICEIIEGEPLPGTPFPVAVITMNSGDYRKLALGIEGPLSLYAGGKVSAEGSWLKALAFLKRFEKK